MFIFIRKNGYYASQKRLCKQPVLRGGIFIAFSKRQFEVKKSPKIQLYQYVREWLDTGKKFSGLIKKSACLLLPLNIVMRGETAGCITPFYKKNLFSIRQVIQLEYRCSYNLPNRAKTAKLTLRKVLQL